MAFTITAKILARSSANVYCGQHEYKHVDDAVASAYLKTFLAAYGIPLE